MFAFIDVILIALYARSATAVSGFLTEDCQSPAQKQVPPTGIDGCYNIGDDVKSVYVQWTPCEGDCSGDYEPLTPRYNWDVDHNTIRFYSGYGCEGTAVRGLYPQAHSTPDTIDADSWCIKKATDTSFGTATNMPGEWSLFIGAWKNIPVPPAPPVSSAAPIVPPTAPSEFPDPPDNLHGGVGGGLANFSLGDEVL